MDENVIAYLHNRLPDELLINHIYPHLYEVQPKKLLVDIRSYVSDLELLLEVYNTEFNEVILFNDMVNFVTRRSLSIQMMNTQYECILRRYFMLWYKSTKYIIRYYANYLVKDDGNYNSKIRFMWGLLTPSERNNFIRRYIRYIGRRHSL
jgi:hypothetical protein